MTRKSKLTLLILGTCLTLAAGLTAPHTLPGGDGDRGIAPDPKRARYVVHEWGTFTNFSGSSGIQLEFRPLEDNELPRFVLNRARQNSNPFLKPSLSARQRMETPVTYFYSDRPHDVDVRVGFPQGLLTEFYPPVKRLGPHLRFDSGMPLTNSFLDWGRVRVLPMGSFQEVQEDDSGKFTVTRPPQVEGDNHYAYARETDSALLEVTDAYGIKHLEKFLFYRGVGNFELPLTLSAHGHGRYTVSNAGSDAVESLFLVRIEQGKVRFSYAPRVAAYAELALHESAAEASLEELGDAMVHALTATGLYDKEAKAMVKTWRSSWFGEEGTRLLYFVPERLTEDILPLTVSPPPDELVRVLVGRMEIQTPEEAARLAGAIRAAGTCTSITCEPLKSELARLGRFAEPALVQLRRTTASEPLGETIDQLIADLRAVQ